MILDDTSNSTLSDFLTDFIWQLFSILHKNLNLPFKTFHILYIDSLQQSTMSVNSNPDILSPITLKVL